MSKVRGYVLLPALCVVLMASGCGQSAPQKKADEVNASVRNYSTTPAAAAHVLNRLSVPAGFRRSEPCGQKTIAAYTVCFRPRQSIVPDQTVMADLVARFGAKMEPATVSCPPVKHFRRSPVSFVACSVGAKFRGDRLIFQATARVVASEKSGVGGARGLPRGLELEITDVGH
jgi:hypothetical protein